MDSWAYRWEFVEHVRKWLTDGDTPRQAFYFYDDSVDCAVDVEPGKRVKVTFEIEDDPHDRGESRFDAPRPGVYTGSGRESEGDER